MCGSVHPRCCCRCVCARLCRQVRNRLELQLRPVNFKLQTPRATGADFKVKARRAVSQCFTTLPTHLRSTTLLLLLPLLPVSRSLTLSVSVRLSLSVFSPALINCLLSN